MSSEKTGSRDRNVVRPNRRRSAVVSLCVGIIAFAVTGTAARAVNYTWNGSFNERFDQPLNWTPNGVPDDNTDNAIFVADPSPVYLLNFFSSMANKSLEVRTGTVTLWDWSGSSTYTLDSGGIFATAVIGSTAGPLTQLSVRSGFANGTSSIAANGPLFVALPAGSNGKLALDVFFWNSTSSVQIGIGGTGELELKALGVLSNTNALLGNDAFATGTAIVGGLGSSWTNTGTIRIGNFGTGILTINPLGTVSNDGDGTIAHFGGSTGTVLVTGVDAEWQNNASLYVGGNAGAAGGTATLTVEADGVVTVVNDLMLYAGNTVVLNGGVINAGSLSGAPSVLNWTTGTLNITGAGVSIDPSEPLGDDRQIGNGQTLSVSGLPSVLNVGVNVGATLTVIGGGTVTGNSGLIGSLNGGSVLSTARITGGGSTWTLSGDLGMRSVNGANLIVEDGGVVSNQDALIAWLAGTTADIDLTGADAQWNSSGSVYLGGDAVLPGGSGNLRISSGAEMNVTGTLKVWYDYYVDVSGGGILTTPNLDLYGGLANDAGTVEILGGTVNVMDPDALLEGAIDIQGSTMNITGGGQFFGTVLGDANTHVTLQDSDSVWWTEASLDVGTSTTGSNQIGTLTVSIGTVVNVEGGLTLLAPGALALNGGTINASEIDLRDADFQGFGALNGRMMDGDAAITATGALTMGAATHPLGFSHGGQLNVGPMAVTLNSLGFARPGALTTIQTDGTLTAVNGLLLDNGDNLTGSGTVLAPLAAGIGSVITVAEGDELDLGHPTALNGFFSDGVLNIARHGVTLHDANEAVLGSLTVLGSGDFTGWLVAANGAVLEFGKNLIGHGLVNTPDDPTTPLINNGSIIGDAAVRPITLSGYVKGVGTMDNVTITGTDAPGFSTARVYRGNMTYGGALEIEIGGLSPGSGHDQVNHSGVAVLGGELRIEVINGFEPSVGQSFVIMTFASHTGEFALVTGRGDCAGPLFQVEYNETDVTVAVVEPLTGDVNIDGKVDLNDYKQLAPCLTGPVESTIPGCECFDLDQSGAIDLRDFQTFQTAMTAD